MNDESAWVEQARQGNRTAFRHLVDAHARPLFHVCARITHDAAQAEDAVQEALLNAWRHLPEFDRRSSFRTWLHRIGVNAALEQLRRNERHVRGIDAGDADEDFLHAIADPAAGPERHADADEMRRTTSRVLEDMSALERTAFVLRHSQGESLEDIAQTLSLSIGACKQAIFRAVRKLRGALEPMRAIFRAVRKLRGALEPMR
jgi:RNA polymerase sigma-70 factor, ECF subfamily